MARIRLAYFQTWRWPMASSDSPCAWGFGSGISWLWHLPRHLWRGQANRMRVTSWTSWPRVFKDIWAGRALLRANINIQYIIFKLGTCKSLQSLQSSKQSDSFQRFHGVKTLTSFVSRCLIEKFSPNQESTHPPRSCRYIGSEMFGVVSTAKRTYDSKGKNGWRKPLGWRAPSCLIPPPWSLLEVDITLTNKYPLYKVYMGLIIKGTIPRVPPFSLWMMDYEFKNIFWIVVIYTLA